MYIVQTMEFASSLALSLLLQACQRLSWLECDELDLLEPLLDIQTTRHCVLELVVATRWRVHQTAAWGGHDLPHVGNFQP